MTAEAIVDFCRLDVSIAIDRTDFDLWSVLAGVVDNLPLVLGELVNLKAQTRIRRIARPLHSDALRPMVDVQEVHVVLVPLTVVVPHIRDLRETLAESGEFVFLGFFLSHVNATPLFEKQSQGVAP